MSNLDDVTDSLHQWIIDSCAGDEPALNHLAEYLLPKAFRFANHMMQNLSPMDDFEDVAISAVKSICIRFRQGQNEFLGERELDSLLRQFVVGKIRDRRKYHFAEKRDITKHSEDENASASNNDSRKVPGNQDYAIDGAKSVWLDEQSINLSVEDQSYLKNILNDLGADVQGLFSELVKRLDAKPRKVLMLITEASMSNLDLAATLDCAPTSVERYRRAIRSKLEEIVNE